MEDAGDNVVQLVQPKPEEETPLSVAISNEKTYQQKRCTHPNTEICETDRTFQCLTCGAYIDPFEYVLSCAKDSRHVVKEISELRARRTELRESVANLEREEKNAKARLRSARTSILFAENDLKNVEQGVKP
ncbi:hypothetical protein DDM29_000136 [Escherichia coli]|nr:hypothetical protein [Escherichia coli]